jgi:hypothetical protein
MSKTRTKPAKAKKAETPVEAEANGKPEMTPEEQQKQLAEHVAACKAEVEAVLAKYGCGIGFWPTFERAGMSRAIIDVQWDIGPVRQS